MSHSETTSVVSDRGDDKAEKLPYFVPAIDKGIPLPPEPAKRAKTNAARVRWPFATMEVGDSVLIPDWAEPTRAMASVDKGRRDKLLPKTYKIAIRLTPEGYRVWRTA